MLDAPRVAAQGDPMRALEGVLPKGFRDVLRAARYNSEGITTRKGERIDGGKDPSGYESVMTALGVGSSRTAEVYERRNAVQGENRRVTRERARLMREWRQASGEDRADVQREIQRFNQGIPAEGREFRITRANLLASQREATRRTRESGGEDYLPRNRRFLRQEGEFAND
jgi:hypothetical protein